MNTRWLIALILLFLVTVFLITGIDRMHMRADENLVYDFTNRSLPGLVQFLAEQDVHPPGWFSSFWAWRQVAGDSEFVARVYTALTSMLTLAIVYQIGRRWFGAARYGWFAIVLLGVNAFFFVHALEIRPYGHIMLVAAVSMWAFQRWLTRRTWHSAVYYALTLPAMLYIHYFLFVLILVQVAYFLVFQRLTRQLLRQAAGIVTLAGLLWLPWFPAAVYQILHLRASDTSGGNERGIIGSGATTIPTTWGAVENLAQLASNGLVWLYLALLLAGGYFWWRSANYRLALVWALLAPAVSLLLNFVLAVYLPRYVVYMVIGLALVIAAGLGRLHHYVRVPALVGVAALSLWFLPSQLPHDRIPYRDLFRQVSAEAKADDVIFFDTGGLGRDGLVRAQIRRYMDPALFGRRVSSLEEAAQHRRVWYVTHQEWFTDMTRERFAQLEQTHPLQEVIGRCDRDWCYLLQLMEAPPNDKPVLFGDALAFMGVDVDEVSAGAIDVRLWWTVETPVSLDYSIGLHLLNENGELVAQHDGAPIDQYSGEPVQTSTFEPGKIVIDARKVALPAGLPPGVYDLTLIAYQSWDQVPLLLPGGEERLLLETITVE